MTHVYVLAEEIVNKLPFPTWVFPLIGAIFFALAFFVVWSYRDVANRHREKASAHDAPTEHGTGTGH